MYILRSIFYSKLNGKNPQIMIHDDNNDENEQKEINHSNHYKCFLFVFALIVLHKLLICKKLYQ